MLDELAALRSRTRVRKPWGVAGAVAAIVSALVGTAVADPTSVQCQRRALFYATQETQDVGDDLIPDDLCVFTRNTQSSQ